MLRIDKIHSLALNVQDYLNGKEENLFRNRYFPMIPEKKQQHYKNIIMFYDNGYFTTRQLMLYIVYYSIWDEKFFMKASSWDCKHIDEISKLFTPEQLKRDTELINGLIKKGYLTNIYDYVTLNNSGEMIALELMREKHISPIFVIRFKDRLVLKSEHSKEIARMLRIVSALESILKTELLK